MTREDIQLSRHFPTAYKVFRVRRYSGKAGGSNFYHHADVVCKNREVLNALVKNNLIVNWRRIDRFGESDTDYHRFEVLGEIEVHHMKLHRTYITE